MLSEMSAFSCKLVARYLLDDRSITCTQAEAHSDAFRTNILIHQGRRMQASPCYRTGKIQTAQSQAKIETLELELKSTSKKLELKQKQANLITPNSFGP